MKNPAAQGGGSAASCVLKRASRSAQQTAKISTMAQPMLCSDDIVHKYKTAAGATPKLTKSDRLSSSAPKREVTFNSRAMRPSSPSKIPAAIIA